MNPKLKKRLFGSRKSNMIALPVIAVLYFVFPIYNVSSGSMEPEIPVGSTVVTLRSTFMFGAPENGDILMFDPVEGISLKPWTHRVIASSGDRLLPPQRIGRKDTDDQIDPIQEAKEITIPEGYIYQSGDAARSYHGLVNTDLINGKVLFSFKAPWK